MSDPIRLLASPDATDLERELLKSWDDERPSSSARDKTFALLGVTSGALAAGGVATASIAPKAIAAGWLAAAKWIVVSVAVFSAIGVGAAIALRNHTPLPPPIVATPMPPLTPTATAQPTVEQTTIENDPAPSPTHVVAPHQVASAPLTEQVAALDRAHAALESGDTRAARKLVDAYEAQYPGGAFTQEAEVVRIDALVRENDHATAERAGKHFLAAYPKSPHAARVRALLGYDP
jgi:TolA-binding protein